MEYKWRVLLSLVSIILGPLRRQRYVGSPSGPLGLATAEKVVSSKVTTAVELSNYLFNLDDDPTEDVNLWDAVEYVNLKAKLAARLDYWMQLRIDPQVPDTTGADDVYTAAGGYVPWLEAPAEASTPLAVERKYDAGGAPQPHIVFVLVDDWGWVRGGIPQRESRGAEASYVPTVLTAFPFPFPERRRVAVNVPRMDHPKHRPLGTRKVFIPLTHLPRPPLPLSLPLSPPYNQRR